MSISDSTAARTLTTGEATTQGANNMSVAQCTSACAASKFTLAGVEFGSQCCKSCVSTLLSECGADHAIPRDSNATYSL